MILPISEVQKGYIVFVWFIIIYNTRPGLDEDMAGMNTTVALYLVLVKYLIIIERIDIFSN